MTKPITLLAAIILMAFSASAQTEDEKALERFIKENRIDSLYDASLAVQHTDPGYEQALLFRSTNGWLLQRTDQLKKDIPVLVSREKYAGDLAYLKVMDPQQYPPFLYPVFRSSSDKLLGELDKKSAAYREVLGFQTMVDYLMGDDDALAQQLPELLKLLKPGDAYNWMLWQYGSALQRLEKYDEAIAVYQKGLKQNAGPDFLQSLVTLYHFRKQHDEILKLEEPIAKDTSAWNWYYLGHAYKEQNKTEKAKKYFDGYTSRLIETKHPPFVRMESSNRVNHPDFEQLEVLGDFYAADKERACKYHELAFRIASAPMGDNAFHSRLAAISDPARRDKMIAAQEEERLKKQEAAIRLQDKMSGCR